MGISRRRFLSRLGSFAVAGAFFRPASLWAAPPRARIPKTGKYLLPLAEMKPVGAYGKALLGVLDLDGLAVKPIPMPFYAHSLVPLPHGKGRLLGVPKRGRELAIVNTETLTAGVSARAEDHHIFLGHGSVSPDGALLLTAEHDEKNDVGVMVVRDPNTLKPLREFSSLGGHPHECRFTADGSAIRVVNSGYTKAPFKGKAKGDFDTRSHVAWLDPSSGKLLKRLAVEKPMVLSHFHEDSESWVVSGGFREDPASREGWGGIAAFDPSGKSRLAMPPPHLRELLEGDAASLILREQDHQAFVLSNRARRLFRWNYRTGALVSAAKIGRSSSIAWVAAPNLAVLWEIHSYQFQLIDLDSMAVLARCPFPEATGLRPGPHFLGPV